MKILCYILIVLIALYVIVNLMNNNKNTNTSGYSKCLNSKENYENNKKKLRATDSPSDYNKMILANGNGDLQSIGCPKGVIWLWSGSIENVPDGWVLCNGENGTPDLRGRFVLGVNPNTKKNADFMINEITAVGGSETHNHKYFDTMFDENTRFFASPTYVGHPQFGASNNQGGSGAYDTDNSFVGQWRFTGEEQTQKGIDTQGRIMPPYYTLAYIMKIV